jgi:transketolase
MQYTSYEEYLKDLALADESIVVVTAENRALIRNLPAVLGPRFIDTGITEQSMIGTSAGLALRGRKPIVHALASFLTMRAFEFIRTDVGISGLPVKLTSFVPGFLSDGNGPTHQAIEDISLMRGIPGMQVYAPADNEDMILMLESIWKNNSPVYLRANTRAAVYQHAPFEIGKAEVIAEGTDVTLMVYGMLLEETLKTKTILESHGLKVGLANMRSLAPVDEAYILKTATSSKLLVTIEDHFLTGGLYSIMAEIFLKHKTTADVLPIALKTWYKPGLLSEVLEYEGFTGEKMAARILDHLKIKHDLAKAKSQVVENTFDE